MTNTEINNPKRDEIKVIDIEYETKNTAKITQETINETKTTNIRHIEAEELIFTQTETIKNIETKEQDEKSIQITYARKDSYEALKESLNEIDNEIAMKISNFKKTQ